VIRRIALVIESSARCRRTRAPSSSMPNQATVRPASIAAAMRETMAQLRSYEHGRRSFGSETQGCEKLPLECVESGEERELRQVAG
jgi:hypothetical protein